MLQQLGLDPWEEAARLAKNPPAGWPRSQENWDQLRLATSPAIPISQAEPISGFDPDAFTREIHDNVWNGISQQFQTHMQRICSSRARLSVLFWKNHLSKLCERVA